MAGGRRQGHTGRIESVAIGLPLPRPFARRSIAVNRPPPGMDAGMGHDDPWQISRTSRRLRRQVEMQEIGRSEEHTSELQSLMRISYAVFCLKKKTRKTLRNDIKQT